jgi:hypothetical protein
MTRALTRVALVSVNARINVYLRFGAPARWEWRNAHLRYAFFAPESIFSRVWWEGNAYGTTAWRLAIFQARAPGQTLQSVVGVRPGGAILLQTQGDRGVKRVLSLIAAIELHGTAPKDVGPSYWRTVHNRLLGRSDVGPYGFDRRAAETARKHIQ